MQTAFANVWIKKSAH